MLKRQLSRLSLVAIIGAGTIIAPLSHQAQAEPSRAEQMAAREHINKGNYYLGHQSFKEAIAEYEEARLLDRTNSAAATNIVLAHLNWGALYYSQHRWNEAQNEWETALKLDPYCKDAKFNLDVLKKTIAREHPTSNDSGAPTSESKKAVPAPSAVLLTPLKKHSGDSTPAHETGAAAQSGASAGYPSQQTGYPNLQPAAKGFTGQGPETLEDKLAQLEVKVYGHKAVDLPVIKRLEHLESDTSGSIRSGTIKERIDFLRHNYGL